MPQIATLKRWPPTALWPHEALSFNPWLAEHLEALDDALNAGWTLTEGKVQQEAGEMWVDHRRHDERRWPRLHRSAVLQEQP
jgi:hypothetical protein